MTTEGNGVSDKKLRSRAWFDNPDNPGHDRALSRALSQLRPDAAQELQSGKPIIGIAQTGSDLSPCNRAPSSSWPSACATASARPAASPSNFRCIRSRKPASARPPASTATSLISSLVEVLYGYPLDGVVLTIGCDKTTPAMLMARGDREHPGDRAVGRPDAQRLAPRGAHRLGHHRAGRPASCMRRGRDQLRAVHRHGRLVGALDRLLQHHGHGARR